MKNEEFKISEYCKICNMMNSCEKSKTCSCENFTTDIDIKIKHRKR